MLEKEKKVAKFAGKVLQKTFTVKDKKGARLLNGYTGRKARELPFMAALGVGAAVTMAPQLGNMQVKNGQMEGLSLNNISMLRGTMGTRTGTVTTGELPSMIADGGSNIRTPDLGASGDVVLGMHNRRKG